MNGYATYELNDMYSVLHKIGPQHFAIEKLLDTYGLFNYPINSPLPDLSDEFLDALDRIAPYKSTKYTANDVVLFNNKLTRLSVAIGNIMLFEIKPESFSVECELIEYATWLVNK